MTPRAPSDPAPRRVTVAGGRPLTYLEAGEGPPLLAVHGVPASARDWRWLGPCVEPHLRLLRLDMPGFGDTPRATLPDPGLEARAELLLRFADVLGLGRFAVVGHSMGGPVALALAARAPDRVSALGLVASVGLRSHRAYRQIWLMRRLTPALSVPPLRRWLLPGLRAGFRRFGFPAYPDEILMHTMRIVARFDFDRVAAHAAAVVAPTLVAWALDDAFIEPAVSAELAAAVPAGPRLVFERGGHNLQKTHAVELGEALVALVKGAS